MNSKATREIVYEDFEPTYNWVREEESDTLVLLLSGFRREEMKVQVTLNHILKVNGEEKKDKTSVRRRFYREFSVPKDANINQIVAKFEDGKLYIKLPKTMTTTKKKPSPSHKEEGAVSKANKHVSQKKKEEEDEAINDKKQVWKLMIGFIVALVMLVSVIGIGFRNNAMQHYSSPLGTSDIQELFIDA